MWYFRWEVVARIITGSEGVGFEDWNGEEHV